MPRSAENGRDGGRRILLTGARGRVAALAHGCRALGLEPVLLPCIDTEPLDIESVPSSGIVIFTSVQAVPGATRPLPWPGTRALAIGRATHDALVAAGQRPVAAPVAPYTSEALLGLLLGPDGPSLDDGVTIVKGVGGRAALADALSAAGVSVHTVESYRRVRPVHAPVTVRTALSPLPDVLCTTSDEGLDNLLAIAGAHAEALLGLPLLVNGERAAAHARSRGFSNAVLVPDRAGDAGQLDRLAGWLAAAGSEATDEAPDEAPDGAPDGANGGATGATSEASETSPCGP